MPTYTATKSGVGIIADSKHVPNDTSNRDWAAKLEAETGGPISINPALYLTISAAIDEAVNAVNVAAAALRDAEMPAGPGSGPLFYLRHQEALAASVDGTPTSGEYPLLHAEVPQTAASIALVATAVLAEVAAIKTAWAAIEDVRVTAIAALEACLFQAEIDAILAGISWPS